jgi:hypothetical protein
MEKTNISKKTRVQIPIKQGENLVRFPNKCVYCGTPPKRAWKLTVSAQQEVGKVRRIFAQKAYLRTLAGVKTLTSTSPHGSNLLKGTLYSSLGGKMVF